jgi:plasmid stability protein
MTRSRESPSRSAIIAISLLMAQLLVRNIESEVVRELKLRAVRHGRSAEEEHREILRQALAQNGPPVSFKELLLEIPDVGEDQDFERPDDRGRAVEL